MITRITNKFKIYMMCNACVCVCGSIGIGLNIININNKSLNDDYLFVINVNFHYIFAIFPLNDYVFQFPYDVHVLIVHFH